MATNFSKQIDWLMGSTLTVTCFCVQYIYIYIMYICIYIYIYKHIYTSCTGHKAVAEVSKIENYWSGELL